MWNTPFCIYFCLGSLLSFHLLKSTLNCLQSPVVGRKNVQQWYVGGAVLVDYQPWELSGELWELFCVWSNSLQHNYYLAQHAFSQLFLSRRKPVKVWVSGYVGARASLASLTSLVSCDHINVYRWKWQRGKLGQEKFWTFIIKIGT